MTKPSKTLPQAKPSSQVFLSYANEDRKVAHQISDALLRHGVRVWDIEFEIKAGDSISAQIEEAISASDYLVILLSTHSTKSKWVSHELSAAENIRVLTARDITILPVLIEDCSIPASLSSLVFLDLRSNLDAGIDRLVEQIAAAPHIDFSMLDRNQFENLVRDLLSALGFSHILKDKLLADSGFDFLASFKKVDPFGLETIERWAVVTKLYRESRPDLRSLLELTALVERSISKVLLVTNGQLTSATANWVSSREAQNLRVVDGVELKRLLTRYPRIVHRYFQAGSRS